MGSSTLKSSLAALALLLAASRTHAQVFVVGEKTATEDVITEFHPTHIELPDDPLDERGRLDLIRNLEAEQGFAHRELPFGPGLTLIANGTMSPRDEDYKQMLYKKGKSANPGDRLAITALQFKEDRIIIDFNGGPYEKHRFLSHLSLNDMPIAEQGAIATGCRITLIFEGGLPAVTAPEVKALLDPLVDFRAKSSEEAYADTLSPKVRAAVEAHEILVGMTTRMVLASLGPPHDRHREHAVEGDPNSPMYEEWIYGQPPQPTQFVRFREGHVIRLEIAALGKPIEVHDKNELGAAGEPALPTRTVANGDSTNDRESGRSGPPPSLRLPGETLPGMAPVNNAPSTPAPPSPTQLSQIGPGR